MAGRPHSERLRLTLDEVRTQLVQTVSGLTPEELNYAPRDGMKSYKQILQEVGTMERLTQHMATHGEELDWGTEWQALDKNDVGDLLSAVTNIRAETLAYLDKATDESLQTPIPLTEEWQGYFHAPFIEPEELMLWILRHEYYHLGQINTYQMLRGVMEP